MSGWACELIRRRGGCRRGRSVQRARNADTIKTTSQPATLVMVVAVHLSPSLSSRSSSSSISPCPSSAPPHRQLDRTWARSVMGGEPCPRPARLGPGLNQQRRSRAAVADGVGRGSCGLRGGVEQGKAWARPWSWLGHRQSVSMSVSVRGEWEWEWVGSAGGGRRAAGVVEVEEAATTTTTTTTTITRTRSTVSASPPTRSFAHARPCHPDLTPSSSTSALARPLARSLALAIAHLGPPGSDPAPMVIHTSCLPPGI